MIELALRAYPVFSILQPLFAAMLFLGYSAMPLYYFSYFPTSFQHSNFVLGFFACIEFLEFVLILNTFVAAIFPLFCYWYSMSTWLKEIMYAYLIFLNHLENNVSNIYFKCFTQVFGFWKN